MKHFDPPISYSQLQKELYHTPNPSVVTLWIDGSERWIMVRAKEIKNISEDFFKEINTKSKDSIQIKAMDIK